MNSTEKTSTKTKIALIGSKGKMGQKILELSKDASWLDQVQMIAELDSGSTPNDLPSETEVIIDFSGAASSSSWAEKLSALNNKTPYLICSTGFNADEFSKIKSQFANRPWAFIPNTSLGIFAFIQCLRGLIAFFNDIKSVEIHDVHHVHKKDQPSGTALLIKAALSDMLKNKGFPQDINILSSREGEVIGIHTVIIQRAFDRLLLTHEAQDRKLFAQGALNLAVKLAQKAPREKPYTFDELL
ncbi:MAG: dihydrodipicolinate reductase C-terminal domain-containing protein [Bdellovibrionota bacterium]